MWGANEGMGWWMVFGGVFWIVVLGLIAYAVAGFARRQGSSAAPAHEAAVEIARRRYAAGEISAAEFERLRKDLTS